MTLQAFFQQNPRVALAFSGGVDSAYLLYAAKEYAEQVGAYYVKSPFQPQFEWEDAQRLAGELGVPLTTIPLDVLGDESIAANPGNRCYFCKRRIFAAIIDQARADGFSVVLDGTNASDDPSDRPGVKALRELGVRSPLRECGLTKGKIRQLSRQAGLFTWDKPPYACLATRVPTGEPLTEELLRRVEGAEAALVRLGYTDLRVRVFHGAARLQLPESQWERAARERKGVREALLPFFSQVYLDTEVR